MLHHRAYTPNFCFHFTGKEKDPETGYSYFGARYLDHELMTGWLSVDPMSDKYPSISPYAYCAWNPVKLVDPDGDSCVFVNEEARVLFYRVYNNVLNKISEMNERNYEYQNMQKLKMYFDDVLSASTVFYFRATPREQSNGDIYIEGGNTYGTPEVNGVCVDFVDLSETSLVHETRHAYGFLQGEWNFNTSELIENHYSLVNYDYMDEFEAYIMEDSYRYVTSGEYRFHNDGHIKREIMDTYKKDYIIKEFKQYTIKAPYNKPHPR